MSTVEKPISYNIDEAINLAGINKHEAFALHLKFKDKTLQYPISEWKKRFIKLKITINNNDFK